MALSGAGAGAADALREMLRQKFLEQIQRARLTEDARQADMGNAIQRGNLDLGGRRLDEEAKQFGVSSGQGQQRIDLEKAAQPMRLRLEGAQASELERKPQSEIDARTFTTGRDSAQHGYQMQEIGAQGANAYRIAQLNNQTKEDLAGSKAAQKDANEVADSIALIDQISKDPSLKNAVGPVDQYAGGIINADPTGVNRFKALHDQLVGKMSLAQAGKLKGQGQISDKERAMLAAAATALNRGLSEKDYLAELGKVRDQFTRMQPGAPAATSAPPAAGGGGPQEFDYVPGKGLLPRKPGG